MRGMRMRRMGRMRHGSRARMPGMRMRRVLLQKMRKHRTDGGILRDENRRRVPISAIRRKTRHRMRNHRKGIGMARPRYGRRRLIRQRTGIQNRGRSDNDNATPRKKMMNHRLIRDFRSELRNRESQLTTENYAHQKENNPPDGILLRMRAHIRRLRNGYGRMTQTR